MDIWSLGCIFAEMVNQKPLFPGNSETEEMMKIFQLLGTPDARIWPGLGELEHWNDDFPKFRPKSLAEAVPELCADGVGLLEQMLRYEPASRITAREALQHAELVRGPRERRRDLGIADEAAERAAAAELEANRIWAQRLGEETPVGEQA